MVTRGMEGGREGGRDGRREIEMSADQIFFLTGITKFLLIKCNKVCSNLFAVLII